MSGAEISEIEARNALIDAVLAFGVHAESLILVGSQALYFRTSDLALPVAPATKDADFTIDKRKLGGAPLLEELLLSAGFSRDPVSGNPGAWVSGDNIPVDFMVPALLAGTGNRSAELVPHANYVGRKTDGLEATLLDYSQEIISSLDGSRPTVKVNVAREPALLVAKLVKVNERKLEPKRFQNKDCYDIYRLLWATPPELIAPRMRLFLTEELTANIVAIALEALESLFAYSVDSPGSFAAGQAELGIGDSDLVAARTMAMSRALLEMVRASASTFK